MLINRYSLGSDFKPSLLTALYQILEPFFGEIIFHFYIK